MGTYPDDADGEVLNLMEAEGIDMSQPVMIEFHVAVPDEDSANDTFAALESAGYHPEIMFDEGEPEDDEGDLGDAELDPMWTVAATIEMVPDYDEIVRIQAELSELAKPFGGASDGWGVLLGCDEDCECDEHDEE